MNDMNKKIGIIISKLRKSQNLSQEKLAELSNLHRTYISDVERGNRNITINSLLKISKVFHIPLSRIIKEAEDL